jgi:hypothetical protein
LTFFCGYLMRQAERHAPADIGRAILLCASSLPSLYFPLAGGTMAEMYELLVFIVRVTSVSSLQCRIQCLLATSSAVHSCETVHTTAVRQSSYPQCTPGRPIQPSRTPFELSFEAITIPRLQ